LAGLVRSNSRLPTRPLTRTLEPLADERAEQAWRATGGNAATMELEYAAVYPLGSIWFLAVKRILQAEATLRVGDTAKAVEIIGDVEEVREGGAPSVRKLIPVATIFR